MRLPASRSSRPGRRPPGPAARSVVTSSFSRLGLRRRSPTAPAQTPVARSVGHLAGQPPARLRLAAGQHQQRVDQAVGPLGGVADHGRHPAVLGDVGVGVGQRHVDLGAHHGERRAQLVRGVGDEPLLRLERRRRAGRASRRRCAPARPPRRRRRCSGSAGRASRSPSRRAVAVTWCSGRSARPATTYAPATPTMLTASSGQQAVDEQLVGTRRRPRWACHCAGVHRAAVGEHDRVPGAQLVGGLQRVADQQPGQQRPAPRRRRPAARR